MVLELCEHRDGRRADELVVPRPVLDAEGPVGQLAGLPRPALVARVEQQVLLRLVGQADAQQRVGVVVAVEDDPRRPPAGGVSGSSEVGVGRLHCADEIVLHPRLVGCWSVAPNQGHEYPPPQVLFEEMKAARIVALRIFPDSHRFLANAVSMGELFERMVDQHVPLFVSLRRGMDWPGIYALLAEFPDLTCAICDHGCWGMDRMFRPLLERYPNVYVDTAQYLLDGGIEALLPIMARGGCCSAAAFPSLTWAG